MTQLKYFLEYQAIGIIYGGKSRNFVAINVLEKCNWQIRAETFNVWIEHSGEY